MYHLRPYRPCGKLIKLSEYFPLPIFYLLHSVMLFLFFVSILIVYIFVVLPFLVFAVLALFLSALISFLFHFFLIKGNHFIGIIITCVFINLFYMSLCTCMFYWGFRQIYTVWCLVKTIPTVHGTIYLWNKVSVSTYFFIAYISVSSPKLIHLRYSGNSLVWSVCLTATLICCAPRRLF